MNESPKAVRDPLLGSAVVRCLGALLLAGVAIAPRVGRTRAAHDVERRLDIARASAAGESSGESGAPLEIALSLRQRRLGHLLASWETIGGCGAGGTGGAGAGVKWIGHSTTGGLFQMVSQANYVQFSNGYNFIASTQITRDLSPKWQLGFFVPFLYKYYRDYANLPTDISNAGFGDVNVMITRRLGPINATSITASLGIPTGTYDATYKGDQLTQEKQLGAGRFSGSLTLEHTIDKSWGLIVLGGAVADRGDENALRNYRSPTGSLFAYTGYFLGPFVPAIGLSFTHFLKADRDRGQDQDVPLTLLAANASIEWSSDIVAILAGVSVPYSLRGTPPAQDTLGSPKVTGLQPWIAAIGLSISPF